MNLLKNFIMKMFHVSSNVDLRYELIMLEIFMIIDMHLICEGKINKNILGRKTGK